MKNSFFGLPVVSDAGAYSVLRNWLSIVLFTGIGYFLIAMTYGSVQGDTWMYIQSDYPFYKIQFVILLVAVVFGHICRFMLNKIGDNFFLQAKTDIAFYIVGFTLAFLVINEIGGL